MQLTKLNIFISTLFLTSVVVSIDSSNASTFSQGAYHSIQVNVDSLGNNITGDAANEPTIATNPTNPNNIVIGWRQFDSVTTGIRQVAWAYSQDKGLTWVFPGSMEVEPGQSRSDPVLDVDSKGNFYFQTLHLSLNGTFEDVEVFKSVDQGISWQAPIFAQGINGDKNWMVIDKTGGIGEGNIYATWRVGPNPNHFTRSTNQGTSFETPVNIPLDPTFNTLAIGPNGEVYSAGRNPRGFVQNGKLISNPFLFAKSINAKDSNSSPSFISQSLDMGGDSVSPASLKAPNLFGSYGNIGISADHSTSSTHGNIYVLAPVDPPGNDPLDIHLIRSTDGGSTWSSPIRVNDDLPGEQSWQWFSSHAVAPNSRIDAVWYDTRNSNTYNVSQLFYSYSWDGGDSWSNNIPVSPAFNTHPSNGSKLGDYIHLVNDKNGANVAYTATFNGEQDVYYLRLFPDCNNNGLSDINDINKGTSLDIDASHIPDECEIQSIKGDLDNDGDVDRDDMHIIIASRNQPAINSNDPKDINGDGTITIIDARKLVTLCTRPRCAIQ